MLEIFKTVTPSPEQWNVIIEGMRNPMNSWDKSDSATIYVCDMYGEPVGCDFVLGNADRDLMERLNKGGAVHAKYRRMIPVFVTINAPLYWWKEFDTYKVGTVANSCSTMHKIHANEFALDDFSCEHLLSDPDGDEDGPHKDIKESDFEGYRWYAPKEILEDWIIPSLNKCRNRFLETHDKKYWWQMIQLLPTSYNQRRTVMLNYEVLTNIYHSRKNHKLDEWHIFCEWIESLPYSFIITGKGEDE